MGLRQPTHALGRIDWGSFLRDGAALCVLPCANRHTVVLYEPIQGNGFVREKYTGAVRLLPEQDLVFDAS